jgi:serine/threonine protein kinase/Tfp pilus assembly protein PilF
MSDAGNREVEIFSRAVHLPAGEQAAYLDRACGGDAPLRRQVESLLAAHTEAGDFMQQPARAHPARTRPEPVVAERPGNRIGRYQLRQQIGEGGCGVVFLAEQEEPVRRRVALKIIKPGMDTRSVIARFEAERQALALMDHPNIAKVFDAGATESGRPYFVMELVRGIKITEYCDQHSLSTRDRLGLFVQVCCAVQHAHQKGIIHRDIKPSNILVTNTQEGKPLPVVIDFGIAKATTDQRLTDKTLFTAFEMLIGTPAYMSPEQAAFTSADVDTRTDIYSLGVLLYELLTGSTPFDAGELLKAGLDEVRRVVREQEPPRPSTRLGTLPAATLTAVAQQRLAEPPALIRQVRGDLDWIVMKALEKDRTRRYETANGLGIDVQRFLQGEAIYARPPSKLYRFQRILLRNRMLFAALGVFAALLITGLILVSASLARERRALGTSERDRLKAQQVTKFLKDMLQGVGPSVALGRDTAILRDVLDRTARQVAAGGGLTNQPAVEAELSSLMGRLYMEIGDHDRSEQLQRRALALNRQSFGTESLEAAASLNDLGLALTRAGQWAQAEPVHREALGIRQRLTGPGSAETAVSLGNLADACTQIGKLAEAETLGQQSFRIREQRFGGDSLEVADSLRTLCIVLGDQGKWPEAEAAARRMLAIRRQRLNPEDPLLATTLTDLAWAVGGVGKQDEAELLEMEAMAQRVKVLGADHPDISKSLYLLGDRMRQRGQAAEAQTVLGAALAMQQGLLEQGNPTPLDTLHSLGEALEAQGKFTEAEAMYRRALNVWRQRGDATIPQAIADVVSLARVLMAQKRLAEAENSLNQLLTPAFVQQPNSLGLLYLRAELEARLGRWQQAADDAVAISRFASLNPSHYATVAALLARARNQGAYNLYCARILAASGQTTDPYVADLAAKSCLFLPNPELDLSQLVALSDVSLKHGANDSGAMPFFQLCRSLAEYRQGHLEEAIRRARSACEGTNPHAHAPALGVMAMAQWRLGRREEARASFSRGEALAPPTLPAAMAEDPGSGWLAWVFARIQLDEAAELLGAADSPAKPSGPP